MHRSHARLPPKVSSRTTTLHPLFQRLLISKKEKTLLSDWLMHLRPTPRTSDTIKPENEHNITSLSSRMVCLTCFLRTTSS